MQLEAEFLKSDGSPDPASYEWWQAMVRPKMALFADITKWASVPQASVEDCDERDKEWRETQEFPLYPLLFSEKVVNIHNQRQRPRRLARTSSRSLAQPVQFPLIALST